MTRNLNLKPAEHFNYIRRGANVAVAHRPATSLQVLVCQARFPAPLARVMSISQTIFLQAKHSQAKHASQAKPFASQALCQRVRAPALLLSLQLLA
jgi:hypothetical protein